MSLATPSHSLVSSAAFVILRQKLDQCEYENKSSSILARSTFLQRENSLIEFQGVRVKERESYMSRRYLLLPREEEKGVSRVEMPEKNGGSASWKRRDSTAVVTQGSKTKAAALTISILLSRVPDPLSSVEKARTTRMLTFRVAHSHSIATGDCRPRNTCKR